VKETFHRSGRSKWADRAAMQQRQAEMAAAQAKIDANKAAIAAANKRFGDLCEYNILG
jgi:OmpA-OmpF porin, OOP family